MSTNRKERTSAVMVAQKTVSAGNEQCSMTGRAMIAQMTAVTDEQKEGAR